MFIYKRVIRRLALSGLFAGLLFQSAISQQVVNICGNAIEANGYTFEYSIGEISTSTLTGPANFITQGLLQPHIKMTSTPCEMINETIAYLPNPVQDNLRIVPGPDWIKAYEIFAPDGKLVRSATFINNKINMQALPGGVYFIKLLPGCAEKFKILKVIKQ